MCFSKNIDKNRLTIQNLNLEFKIKFKSGNKQCAETFKTNILIKEKIKTQALSQIDLKCTLNNTLNVDFE